MATDSFKFWDSYMETLDPLPDAQYARLIRAVTHRVFLGEEPDFSDDMVLNALYVVIMRQAEQSRDIARAASENGKKARGIPKNRKSKGGLKGGLSTPKGGPKRIEEIRSDLSPSNLSTPGVAAAPPDGGPRSAERFPYESEVV